MLHYMTVVGRRDLTSCFIPCDEMTHLLAVLPGGPAVSEGGQCSPSPEHQEGHSGPPHQLLRPQLSAAASLRRGITQEDVAFPLYFLPFTDVYSRLQNNMVPAAICQWTNHRVMEWLRSVDLAEYAPNLRGSGVHGGLMVRGRGQRSCSPVATGETRHLLAHLTVSSAGLGATLQRGSSRPATQHPAHQDPAETPPRHALPPACRRRGPAPQTGVSGKPRLQRPHGHRQGQGTARQQGVLTAEGLIVAVFHSRGVCRLAALAV